MKVRVRKLVVLVLSFALLLTMVSTMRSSAATIYWVSTSGSDSNNGSQSQPFRTVQKAASVAVAGDTVMIQPGVYTGEVVLRNSGTSSAPITFKAAQYHAVTMQTNSGYVVTADQWQDGEGGGPIKYITFKGIIFDTSTSPSYYSVRGSEGWNLEDCIFNHNGLLLRGGGTVTRCIAQDTVRGGMSLAFGKFDVMDCIIRRANQSAYSPGGYEGACKTLITHDMVVDGLISYDNYGSGWWMDWNNRNFTVRNCTIFGNHAGVAYEDGNVLDHWWAAPGIWSEGNPGPGLIENNTIFSNVVCGIGLLESGVEQKIIVRNNLFVDNGSGVDFRAVGGRNEGQKTGPTDVVNNQFKNWRGVAWCSYMTDTFTGDKPSDEGIIFNNNIYQKGAASTYASWDGKNQVITAESLSEVRSKLGAEVNGSDQTIDFDGTLIPTYSITNTADLSDPAKMHQVNSSAAEAAKIDNAISGVAVGGTATIPVLGRARDISYANGVWTFDLYDLQARHVKVTVNNSSDKSTLENLIKPYAKLIPVNVTITLTRKDSDMYAVEGSYPAGGSTPTPGAFVKGINCNGNAETIEGNSWLSHSAAVSAGFNIVNGNVWAGSTTFSPAVDAATNRMLNTQIFREAATVNLTQTIANGTYNVYIWTVENYQPYYRSFNLNLEGAQKAANIGSMPLNEWRKYGPYTVTVNDGMLNIDLVRVTGDPEISGIAIFNADTPTPGGVNVALNKTATADSVFSGNTAAKAVDGSTADANKWASTDTTGPHWIEVDLGATHTLYRDELYIGNVTPGYAPTNFKLQYWTGSAWADIAGTVVSGNPSTAVYLAQTFTTPVTTNKVRFYCTDNKMVRVRELMVYN